MSNKRFTVWFCFSCVIPAMTAMAAMLAMPYSGRAADSRQNDSPGDEQPHHLEDIEVQEKTGAPGLVTTPMKTVIDVDKLKTIGPQTSILEF